MADDLMAPGDLVMFIDSKQRRYMVKLAEGHSFHLHTGIIEHDSVIGLEPGVTVRTSGGSRLLAVRPTLSDYILKMPRGAQVIYPKDLGPIIMLADIEPGMRVLEAGLGSGALSLTLLRAIGSEGSLVTYEMRDDHAARGLKNIADFLGCTPINHEVRIGDICDGIDSNDFDRIVLDLPDPWGALPAITPGLRPGGIVLCYLPTVPQVSQVVEALRDHGFGMVESVEILARSWHVEGMSVRPEHRMVGHTGFLVSARRLAGEVD
ncbi:MAG: hypothetical protein DCC49_01350 [Acidobacteria bacterium]|nr:MAG: hypothetical protein DCC49_01350 [Acidobacteriota bacterium]